MAMTFGSLFAGIGGFDLGFERAGMTCEWEVELDEYCNRVLERHWPDVRKWGDIRTFPPEPASEWSVDVVCGGFPCQDISIAGNGRGIDGERSGLWREMYRVVETIRPPFVVIENTPPLLNRGLHIVLRDLAACGYDAEWHVVSARQFGLANRRDRFFIIAYTNGIGRDGTGCDHAGVAPNNPGWIGIPSADGCKDGWDLERWVSSFYAVCGFPPANPATKRVVDGIPSRLDRCRVVGNSIVPAVAEWIGRRIVTLYKEGEDNVGT